MIDAHFHLMDIGFKALTLDLSDTNSLAEAQAKIAEYAAKYPMPPVDRRPGLEPGEMGPRPLPDRRRDSTRWWPTGRCG